MVSKIRATFFQLEIQQERNNLILALPAIPLRYPSTKSTEDIFEHNTGQVEKCCILFSLDLGFMFYPRSRDRASTRLSEMGEGAIPPKISWLFLKEETIATQMSTTSFLICEYDHILPTSQLLQKAMFIISQLWLTPLHNCKCQNYKCNFLLKILL